MKIIEKINGNILEEKPFYSFEFFPPKTEAGLTNLYNRLDRMIPLSPSFIDVTWGAGGSANNELSLELSRTAQSYFGYDVMMHLTCTGASISEIDQTLEKVQNHEINNILALRGDPPQHGEKWQSCDGGFSYASELIEHIRAKFGESFGIAVAGYPEGHLESESKDSCVKFLKAKMDKGADFIITQLFYDMEEFFEFEKLCRQVGIQCPIIPGIMPIQNYQRFKRFTDMCQTKVPEAVQRDLEAIKNDDAAVQKYGIDLAVKMCRTLLEKGTPGLHFYTMNLETSVTEILKELELTTAGVPYRTLPWRPSAASKRRNESVRPIFWSNRPKSYLARTMNWDDFPNGRWGDSRSPSFGNLNDYYLLRRGIGLDRLRESRLKMWGSPQDFNDVCNVFTAYCCGEIPELPWCEMQVHSETNQIKEELVGLNRAGLLTINSQPQVNGADSSDPQVGWGGQDGFVYQKAYIEFFIENTKLPRLLGALDNFPTLSYQAVNWSNDQVFRPSKQGINAVTWGVFPGKEVLQPTVVDPESFMIWKDEAFQLWINDWAKLYPEDSISYKVISEIPQNHYLVNIVENNFVSGNIFEVFTSAGFL